jgi:hypothetical protein
MRLQRQNPPLHLTRPRELFRTAFLLVVGDWYPGGR